jgi:diguanylate cyclase (GGDEF)-like protein
VLYLNPNAAETVARALVAALVLVVVAGIVTLLREGLQERQRELEELAVRDPLTGIGNYRLLTERLAYEIARHRRSSGLLTVMLLDLDGFKEVNDTFGHLVGDSVLRTVADALSAAVRAQDTLARQGGDEFSILAPDTSYEQAARLATRARDAVAADQRLADGERRLGHLPDARAGPIDSVDPRRRRPAPRQAQAHRRSTRTPQRTRPRTPGALNAQPGRFLCQPPGRPRRSRQANDRWPERHRLFTSNAPVAD